MEKRIPLTVALMTFNRSASYLKEAIQGILEQTYQDFEFLILDNGSTDNTPQVVLSYRDKRIRYVRNPPGLSPWFNGASAMKIARGDRILITFDDDILLPTMLERQMKLMDSDPGIVGVWTNIQTINSEGTTIQDYWHPQGEDQVYERGEFLADFLSSQIWPFPCTLMFQRSPRKNPAVEYNYYGGLPPKKVKNLHGGDDIIKLIEFNFRGKIAFINDPLFKYRRHNQQDTHSTDPTLEILNTYKKIKSIAQREPYIPTQVHSTVNAFVTHYAAQHLIATTPEKRTPKKRIDRISSLFNKALTPGNESRHRLLATAILLSHHGRDSCGVLTNGLPPPEPHHSMATHALYAWAKYRAQQKNIFTKIPKESGIAILGSVFIASLLIYEAREHGLKIICCLESNKKRQQHVLLGIPILPIEDIIFNKDIDHVILSSERDQDPYLKNHISSMNPKVRTTSWKELCCVETKRTYKTQTRAIRILKENAS